jgi:hypothetical protein
VAVRLHRQGRRLDLPSGYRVESGRVDGDRIVIAGPRASSAQGLAPPRYVTAKRW